MMGIDLKRHQRNATAASVGKNRLKGQGHPTTAEMNYSCEEMEFLEAIQRWKNKSGKQFPTWAEVLAVLKKLGYHKPAGVKQEAFSL